MGAVLAIAGLLGLVLLALAVPVEAEFQLEGLEPFTGQLRVRWLFGLVRFRLPIPRRGEPTPAPEARPTATRVRARRTARRRSRDVLAALGHAALRRRVCRLVGDLVRAVRLRRFRLLVRLGLGDPADTGCVWAVVGPLAAVAQLRGAEVQIEPDFVDAVLEFRTDGRLLVVPLRVLILALAFALSPPTIRAWRTLRRAHA